MGISGSWQHIVHPAEAASTRSSRSLRALRMAHRARKQDDQHHAQFSRHGDYVKVTSRPDGETTWLMNPLTS